MLFTPRAKGLGIENFLKLNDKEEVTGIFQGQIYTFKKHWANDRSVECTGNGCSACQIEAERNANEPDSKKKRYPAFRFRINFVTTKDGQWVSKIFEGGGETYDLLTTIDGKLDLSKTIIDIARRGVKQNTKYDFFPRSDIPLTKEMEERIKQVPLHALKAEAQE